jgi:hypothetical protein
MVVLQGALDALTLGSEVSFRRRVLVALEEGRVHTHSFERDRTWGPSVGRIDNDAVAFVKAHGGRIVSWIRSETFNRVANAFRLYSTAVHAESPDAALVLLMSCLEGLLTTAADNISFRLSLAVASLMDDAPENRLRTFQRARAIYTARSKIVHGAALSKDEERSAILLVDNILPEAEEFARHALRKILADGLVDVFATSERAERFVVMLALGYEAARAAALA